MSPSNTPREEFNAAQIARRNARGEEVERSQSDPLAFTLPAQTATSDIPQAFEVDTDQSNANRIFAKYQKRLIVIGGKFFHFARTHWAQDEGFASRAGGELATQVREEAKAARTKFNSISAGNALALTVRDTKRRDMSGAVDKLIATPEGKAIWIALRSAEKLERWATACESRTIQRNAIELLRSWLDFDAKKLDPDPALLNCLTGTIDLRTGESRPHDPRDYITKCAPVAYSPNAEAPRFEGFLSEIMKGDAESVDFLQRWLGYAATGETREQKVLFHIGVGANGKGSLQNAVADVLGEYACAAAPGLLTGRGAENRHPTEIIDLMGKRLVTGSESDQGDAIREGFLKQLSGEDTLKGRGMRQDFVEFRPTFKLQLQTNHKPTIKGADFGIWRRILLVNYGVRFGTAAQIAEGKADAPIDPKLPQALRDEREGIFAWIVQGAISWYRFGLQPPESVLAATGDYQSEQDRAAQFVNDHCTLEKGAWVTISDLHLSYKTWCVELGYNALGWSKFQEELQRVVPHFRQDTKFVRTPAKKTVRGCYGLKLANTGADAFAPLAIQSADASPAQVDNGDLL